MKIEITIDYWIKLSLRVMVLFFLAMIVSFLPDYFRSFFGDLPMDPKAYHFGAMIDDNWDWGYRHYLFFYMCTILFGIQSARIIHWTITNSSQFKP